MCMEEVSSICWSCWSLSLCSSCSRNSFMVVVEVEEEEVVVVAAEVFCIVSSRVESNGELQIGKYIYMCVCMSNIFICLHSISFNYMHTINYIVLSCFSHVLSFLLYSKRLKNWLACWGFDIFFHIMLVMTLVSGEKVPMFGGLWLSALASKQVQVFALCGWRCSNGWYWWFRKCHGRLNTFKTGRRWGTSKATH